MGKKFQSTKKKLYQKQDLSHDRRRLVSCNYNILSDTRYQIEEENEADLISNLPDDIIFQFLSAIPYKSALNTTSLSTRWRDLWNRCDLVKHGNKEDIDCVVGDLILHFDEFNPMKHPRRLRFHLGQGLILLATIGLKNKLHLDFSKGNQEFPIQFDWHLVLNSIDHNHQPVEYFVESLNLTSVSYLTNEIVSSLVSNFQSLESLTIAKCKGLQSLHVDFVSDLLNLSILDCPNLESLHIEADELESLRFRGPLCSFLLPGVCYLEDAMFDFRHGPGYNNFEHRHLNALLEAIDDVKILTLCGWMFIAISKACLSSGAFYELKDLWWIESSMEEYKIDALISFLKVCPSLERLYITIDPTSYSPPSTVPKCSNAVSKKTRLKQLKVVKLEGGIDVEDVILFKKHLFEVFNVDPRIIVSTPGSPPRCLVKIPKQQSKNNLKTASKSQKRKSLYKLVEEVEDIFLCSSHAHMDL